MYDLALPIMRAQFNLIKSPNQNIKISFKFLKSIKNKKKFKSYTYNKKSIFDYLISINNSQIDVSLCPSNKLLSLFNKNVMGSFIQHIRRIHQKKNLKLLIS